MTILTKPVIPTIDIENNVKVQAVSKYTPLISPTKPTAKIKKAETKKDDKEKKNEKRYSTEIDKRKDKEEEINFNAPIKLPGLDKILLHTSAGQVTSSAIQRVSSSPSNAAIKKRKKKIQNNLMIVRKKLNLKKKQLLIKKFYHQHLKNLKWTIKNQLKKRKTMTRKKKQKRLPFPHPKILNQRMIALLKNRLQNLWRKNLQMTRFQLPRKKKQLLIKKPTPIPPPKVIDNDKKPEKKVADDKKSAEEKKNDDKKEETKKPSTKGQEEKKNRLQKPMC